MRLTTDQLVEAGVLRRLGSLGSPSQAYAVAHAVVAAKKAAPDAPLLSRFHLAWDYRDANAKARRMPVCAPHVDDVVQFFAGATFLASLDLYSAFFSVPMQQYPPEDGLRVLLVTDRAVFENLRASMGEVNSSAALDAAMNVILEPLSGRVVWYADDVGLKGRTPDELLDSLDASLARLEPYQLYANPKKATLFATELKFLGRVIKSGGTVVLDPTYVEGVVAMAPPPSAGVLRSFLGMLSWCNNSLPHLAEEELPLRTLLQRASAGRPLDAKAQAAIAITPFWDETHQRAFERCKELLRHAIERALEPADHEIVVMTDASSVAWAGFLATCPTAELDKPVESRSLQPVAFVGGTWSDTQRSVPELEVAASIQTIERTQCLLERVKPFYLMVDAEALVRCYSMTQGSQVEAARVVQGRGSRWASYLSRFQCYGRDACGSSRRSSSASTSTRPGARARAAGEEQALRPAHHAPHERGQRGQQAAAHRMAQGKLVAVGTSQKGAQPQVRPGAQLCACALESQASRPSLGA